MFTSEQRAAKQAERQRLLNEQLEEKNKNSQLITNIKNKLLMICTYIIIAFPVVKLILILTNSNQNLSGIVFSAVGLFLLGIALLLNNENCITMCPPSIKRFLYLMIVPILYDFITSILIHYKKIIDEKTINYIKYINIGLYSSFILYELYIFGYTYYLLP